MPSGVRDRVQPSSMLMTISRQIVCVARADYCSVVYNSLIPKYIAENLEKVQRHALRIIYGQGIDIENLMTIKQIETLSEGRDKKCIDFANKAVLSLRFGSKWFKENATGPNVRETTRKKYVEKFSRHERMKNNPLSSLTRLLNQQEQNNQTNEIEQPEH